MKIWIGRILSGLVILFFAFDGITKLIRESHSVEGTVKMGFPEGSVVTLGVLLLVGLVLYAIPRTAPIGAIYLSGYLGGAVASQLRLGAPLFAQVFPVIFAGLMWLGLCLRDARVQRLIASE